MLDALLVAMVCQPFLDAVASVDSALHLGVATLSDLRPHSMDGARSRVLEWIDRRAESGIESMLRVALRMAGLRVDLQVSIPGVGRVDLLVEGCIVVEVDGVAFHSGPRRLEDHQRDAACAAAGYTPLRFTTFQILHQLPTVVDAVITAVRSHRAAGFSGRQARLALDRAGRTVSSGETRG